jgi:ketosteroid isomerase-like protein
VQNNDGPAAADAAFFAALVAGDGPALRALLTEDFLIVDVLRGGVTGRDDFLAAQDTGDLVFVSIEPAEVTIRTYGDTAVVVGRTAMRGRLQGAEFTAASRYTHVYRNDGAWRLASAQGTPISD